MFSVRPAAKPIATSSTAVTTAAPAAYKISEGERVIWQLQPDGSNAVVSADGTVVTMQSPASRIPSHHEEKLRAVASSNAPSEESTPYLVSGGEDRDLCVVHGSTGELIRRISGFTGRPGHPGHTDKIYSIAIWFNPSIQQHYIYSAGEDKVIRVWNLETGGHVQTMDCAHTSFIHTLCINDSTSQIISASYDKTIVIWSMKNAAQMSVLRHDKVLTACGLNVEAGSIASCCGTHVYIWSMQTSQRINTLRLHKRTVVSVVYHRPALLVSGSDDKTLCIWNPTDLNAPLLHRIDIATPAYSLQVYDDNTAAFLLVGGFVVPHAILVYSLEDFALTTALGGHTGSIVGMTLWSDHEGRPKVASVGWDLNYFTWDLTETVQAVHDAKLRAKHKTGKFL